MTYNEEPAATVEVAEYDGMWAAMFDVERELLAAMLPDALNIEHIGSTSIPGLAAKPTIDILVVVDEINDVLERRNALAELGYEYRPKAFVANEEQLFFRKVSGGKRTHHLHVLASSSPKPDQYRLFRDYLITNGDAANRYGEAKRALARQYANERGRYIAEKRDVVSELLGEAMRWRSIS